MRRAAEMALSGAQRAANLTARLLAFSRRQALAPRPADLNAIMREMTELLQRTLGEETELAGVFAAGLWPVEIDANQLESAVLNLAVNARDAMPGGGELVLETANAVLEESQLGADGEVTPGQYVVLAVSDNGAGMSKETLARVFEPFFTTKETGRGTGLGLSQVYGFVKQSGGHVDVTSEVGEGTTIKLYFPRYTGAILDPLVAGLATAPRGRAEEVILVVEDNDDVRAYSVMVLEELGYAVVEATEGRRRASPFWADRCSKSICCLQHDIILFPAGTAGTWRRRRGPSGPICGFCSPPAIPAMRSSTTAGSTRVSN